ncbi:hypothetical protein V5O48_017804 [Marasmius crinis-equi]|uniref:Zn(2)-C6 fungal-type domain-containing protein n=1 Tax=Marasmius crinis-equi TaxID=585013 RepID=A0ABR3EMY9_9AGAR
MQLGSNALMVQDHLNSLRDPAWIAKVLPAVPLPVDRPGELSDPTTGGIRGFDLTSFNPMALTQFDDQGNEYRDAPFQSARPDITGTSLPSASNARDAPTPIPIPNVGQTESQSQSLEYHEPMSNPAPTTQSFLPLSAMSAGASSSEIAATSPVEGSSSGKGKKKPKVCAVCTAHNCPRASVCAGKGNHKLCYGGGCKHPNVGGYKSRKQG